MHLPPRRRESDPKLALSIIIQEVVAYLERLQGVCSLRAAWKRMGCRVRVPAR